MTDVLRNGLASLLSFTFAAFYQNEGVNELVIFFQGAGVLMAFLAILFLYEELSISAEVRYASSKTDLSDTISDRVYPVVLIILVIAAGISGTIN